MDIKIFSSSSGTFYVKEQMAEIPAKAIKKITGKLELLEKHGMNFVTHAGIMKKLHGYDIYEIVIDFNRIFYRIFCVIRNSTCWLLHMIFKKSNKTPLHEIKVALQRSRELDLQLAFAKN
ncbi:type II toxin-antitoxin system RelE/ParE family toxin [Patescibacteria group bacterium]|nr:type II toxin-antitoxin system RelE/ParE family toxin [Patescibacteria group bacterium]MBU4016424.1 type II toxin-antitoxin system RelE/ParE family toxin [Patescibacteria group bacterium]